MKLSTTSGQANTTTERVTGVQSANRESSVQGDQSQQTPSSSQAIGSTPNNQPVTNGVVSQTHGAHSPSVVTILTDCIQSVMKAQERLSSNYRLHLFFEKHAHLRNHDVESKVLYSQTCNFSKCTHKGGSYISQGLAHFKLSPSPTIPHCLLNNSSSAATTIQTQGPIHSTSILATESGQNTTSNADRNNNEQENIVAVQNISDSPDPSEMETSTIDKQFEEFQSKIQEQNIFSWFPGASEALPPFEEGDEEGTQGGGGEGRSATVQTQPAVSTSNQDSSGTTSAKSKRKRKKAGNAKVVSPDSNNTLEVSGMIVHSFSELHASKVIAIYQRFFTHLHKGIRASNYYKTIVNRNSWSGKMSYKSFTPPWMKTFLKVSTPYGTNCMPSNPCKICAVPDIKVIRSKSGANMAARVLSAFYDNEVDSRIVLRKAALEIVGIILPLHPGQIALQAAVQVQPSSIPLQLSSAARNPSSENREVLDIQKTPQASRERGEQEPRPLHPAPSILLLQRSEDEDNDTQNFTSLGALQLLSQPIPNESPLPPPDVIETPSHKQTEEDTSGQQRSNDKKKDNLVAL